MHFDEHFDVKTNSEEPPILKMEVQKYTEALKEKTL